METNETGTKVRKTIPKSARFPIRLDDPERERSMLVPGHRFEPFHPLRISPNHLILLDSGENPIPRKKVVLALEDLYRFHSILYPQIFFSLMEEAAPGNLRLLATGQESPKKSLIRMPSYSLEPFFGKHEIPENTYLRATLQVPSRAVFIWKTLILRIPASPVVTHGSTRWMPPSGKPRMN